MPEFSSRSRSRLSTCHPDLRFLFNAVVKRWDCTILEGVRDLATQEEYVRTGKSKTMNSLHLLQADGWSHAVDVAPYPVDWQDAKGFALFAGKVLGMAELYYEQGLIKHRIRSGVDWDGDGNVREHSFFDGPHFELVKP